MELIIKNMVQAILIIAHKDLSHILRIIDCFDVDFKFYIHLDKKMLINGKEYMLLKSNPNVRFLGKKYSINWGSFNVVRSVLFLCRKALEDEDVSYLHLISGADFPAKGPEYFRRFFQENSDCQYLNYFLLPSTRWKGGGLERMTFYYLTDWFNVKTKKGRRWFERFIRFQKKCGLVRKLSKEMLPLYGGSTWWSLSRKCVQYVVDYTRHCRYYYRRFRWTFIPDEMYFQSVIMRSPFAASVVNDNLRYIDWTYRNGNIPANLDMTDFDKIVASDCVFARKVEASESELLLYRLEEYIL